MRQRTDEPTDGRRPDNLYGPVERDGLIALMVGALAVANRVSPFGAPELH